MLVVQLLLLGKNLDKTEEKSMIEETQKTKKLGQVFDEVWDLVTSGGLTIGEIQLVAKGLVDNVNSIKVTPPPKLKKGCGKK